VRIPELRREIAESFHMTEQSLRQLQTQVPGLTGRHGEGLSATVEASALLVLTAMLGRDRNTIGERVMALWAAAPVKQEPNPLRSCKTLGEALTALFAQSRARVALDEVVVDRDFPYVMLRWRTPVARAVYAPYSRRQYALKMDEREARGASDVWRVLRRTSFDKVANLIGADREAEQNPQ
jgi:hypothetical protein